MDFDRFGTDAVLLTDGKLRQYFSGFRSTYGVLLLFREETVFFTDDRYLEGAKAALAGKAEVRRGVDFAPVFEELRRRGVGRLGYAADCTLVPELRALEGAGPELVDVSRAVEEIMEEKREDEIARVREACRIAEEVYRETVALLRAGMTEKDLASEIEYRCRIRGAEDRSFETIAAFGANAAVPHHEPCERRLKEGDAVLIDFGCTSGGYCSDMTRTLFFGEPSGEFTAAYGAVLAAHEAAAKGIKPGMTGKEADALARDVLDRAGLGAAFTHSLGHGIGVRIHEAPRLSPKSGEILREGMIFSIEPGVYLPGKFGIRIEDTVLLTADGVRGFMTESKSLRALTGGAQK